MLFDELQFDIEELKEQTPLIPPECELDDFEKEEMLLFDEIQFDIGELVILYPLIPPE